jgi:hypothetical protein
MQCQLHQFAKFPTHKRPVKIHILVEPIPHFLKYDERVLSLSFFALAPDCKPSDASAYESVGQSVCVGVGVGWGGGGGSELANEDDFH